MSSAKISEGLYRIICMSGPVRGCLTGPEFDNPLLVRPPGEPGYQQWKVKKLDDDQYVLVLEASPGWGAAYREMDAFSPVVLGPIPRVFKIQKEQGDPDRLHIIPSDGKNESLVMGVSPHGASPLEVALVSKDMMDCTWRFERI